MAELNVNSYKTLYGSSGSVFPNNTTELIEEADLRQFGEDTGDSAIFREHAQNPSYLNATAAGTDTYTATISPAITAYADGQRFYIKFTNANTGAATINLNSLGAKAIVKNGSSAVVSGDISAGQIYIIGYDGTNFQLLGGATSSSATITSGTYTPTLTNGLNVASSTPSACQYMRVGSVVTVSGTFSVDPTAGAPTYTTLDMSLPIASNFSSGGQCGGTAVGISGTTTQSAMMWADASDDRVIIEFFAGTVNPIGFFFSFTYLIV